jgi:hypothetical protein
MAGQTTCLPPSRACRHANVTVVSCGDYEAWIVGTDLGLAITMV